MVTVQRSFSVVTSPITMVNDSWPAIILIAVKGKTSRFGSAIQVLPPDIGEYFSSFFITTVFIYILQLKNVFFISENSCQK